MKIFALSPCLRFVAALLVYLFAACSTPSVINSVRFEPLGSASEYKIGLGNAPKFTVLRNPEILMRVPVRPEGEISTPLVEDLVAISNTASKLARDFKKVLAKYHQQPIVTNFVRLYDQQVPVLRQRLKAQALPFWEKTPLMDVLFAAGGNIKFVEGNRPNVVRTINGTQRRFDVRLNDLMRNRDIAASLLMRSSGSLVISESFF